MQESTRDEWVGKIRKLRKIQRNCPSRQQRKREGTKEEDEIDMPVPVRPFSVYTPREDSILQRLQDFPLSYTASSKVFEQKSRDRKALVVSPTAVQSDLGFAPAAIVRGSPCDSVLYHTHATSVRSATKPLHSGSVTASSKPPTLFIAPLEGMTPHTHAQTLLPGFLASEVLIFAC